MGGLAGWLTGARARKDTCLMEASVGKESSSGI